MLLKTKKVWKQKQNEEIHKKVLICIIVNTVI